MNVSQAEKIFEALECFRIEVPSWGFTNTGTRLGKFIQPAAATTTEEKFSDAGQVHLLTGVCPTVALQVLWDCPRGIEIEQSHNLKGKVEETIQTVAGHSSYLRRTP